MEMEITNLAVGVATLVILVIISYVLSRWRNPRCNGRLPPGSMGLPIIGETLQFLSPGSPLDLRPFLSTRLKRYGMIFKTSLLGRPMVVTADEQFDQMVFQQEGKLFKSNYPESVNKILGVNNFQEQHGFSFKYLKKMMLEYIGHQKLKEVLISDFAKAASDSLDSWSQLPSVELKEAISTTLFNLMATKMLSFQESSSTLDKLRKNVFTFSQGLISFPVYIPGTPFYRSLKARRAATEILKNTLNKRMSSPEVRYGDFWDKLVEELTNKESIVTESIALDMVFAFLFAGFEATSQAITFAFKLLSDHPQVIEKLEEEHEQILKKMGDREDSSTVTWEDYKSMIFTSQVINEILRLANIVPVIFRKTMKDVEYKGYTIPKGWQVMVCSLAIHLNPEIYEDPHSFKPSRWKDITESSRGSKNFMAFGGGMRFCIGADYSMLFMSIFFHRLITNYRYCLWIFGDAETLSKSGSIWGELVEDAKTHHCFFSASEDKVLSEAISNCLRKIGKLNSVNNNDSDHRPMKKKSISKLNSVAKNDSVHHTKKKKSKSKHSQTTDLRRRFGQLNFEVNVGDSGSKLRDGENTSKGLGKKKNRKLMQFKSLKVDAGSDSSTSSTPKES